MSAPSTPESQFVFHPEVLCAAANGDVYHYIVRGDERDVRFQVTPEGAGWAVQIEGIPGPSIVHDQPWPSAEAARAAAVRVIHELLWLELVQREEQERNRH